MHSIACLILLLAGSVAAYAAALQNPELTAERDLQIQLVGAASPYVTYQVSTNLTDWETLATQQVSSTNELTDSGAVYRTTAFYRAVERIETNLVTGDHLGAEGGDITFHPVNHASFIMTWNGLTIYSDPVGGAAPYQSLPRADLIVVTHEHGDHFDNTTLDAVRRRDQTNAVIIVTQTVYDRLTAPLKEVALILTNDASTNLHGIQIEAVPAYNARHPEGNGNSYVLAIGGKRIYISGDTGDTAEMKALRNIDVAFLCMNVPFTMSVAQAAAAVREFAPRVVYPYHFRNQDGTFADLALFRQQVGMDRGIEVRVRDWY